MIEALYGKNKTAKILIIDDEPPIREVLSASLRDEGHQVMTASDGESGLKAMKDFQPQVVFLDIWMPGSLDGLEVLTTARKLYPQIDFVMISGHGTIETAVRATKLGAWDFIEKPLSTDKISIELSVSSNDRLKMGKQRAQFKLQFVASVKKRVGKLALTFGNGAK